LCNNIAATSRQGHHCQNYWNLQNIPTLVKLQWRLGLVHSTGNCGQDQNLKVSHVSYSNPYNLQLLEENNNQSADKPAVKRRLRKAFALDFSSSLPASHFEHVNVRSAGFVGVN